MRMTTFICLVGMGVVAANLPMPKEPIRPARDTSQGAGAKALIKVMPPAPVLLTNVLLTWNYPGPLDQVFFRVRGCKANGVTKPTRFWPVLAQVRTNGLKLPEDKAAKCVWFSVTAVDVTSGIESGFATK